jgi:beta-xylosidase
VGATNWAAGLAATEHLLSLGHRRIGAMYLSDPVAQVVQPVRRLAGFARVELQPGQARRVSFGLHADRTAFCGLAGELIVEPGEIGVGIGGSSECLPLRGPFTLTGPARTPGPGRVLDTPVTVTDLLDTSPA